MTTTEPEGPPALLGGSGLWKSLMGVLGSGEEPSDSQVWDNFLVTIFVL